MPKNTLIILYELLFNSHLSSAKWVYPHFLDKSRGSERLTDLLEGHTVVWKIINKDIYLYPSSILPYHLVLLFKKYTVCSNGFSL